MPSTREFLNLILPSEGWKCAAILRNGKMHHEWTEDIGKLELILLSADEQGATAYHACGAFRSKSRKAAHAQSAQAFWIDVDAGPGKPYGDGVQAWGATEKFRKAASLPPPLYLRSGLYGLHCYWPLSAPLAPDDWLIYAQNLKALCRQHGLQADPTRTADIASILRPPGTHNRKTGEAVLVECGDLVGPYPIGHFHSLRSVSRSTPTAPSAAGRSVPPRTDGLAGQLTASLKEAFERKSYVDAIPRGCRQIARVAASSPARAGTKRLPEPLWHAAIGVAAYAIGGDEAARQWAVGYDGYTEAETSAWVQAKLDRARIETTGPTTCQRFFDLDPAGCTGCVFANKITSPIALGYVDAGRVSTGVSAGDSPVNPGSGNSRPDLPVLPSGYAWSDKGQLTFVSEHGKGIPSTLVISEYPLYLDSTGTAEIDTDTFSYNFKLHMPVGGVRSISVPAQKFMGPEGIGVLFGRGAVIHDRDHFRKYTMAAVDMYNKETAPVARYEQFGWKDNETAFMWGRSLYTGSNILPASAVDEVATRGKLLNVKLGGSLARWSAAANRLFARDCEPHAFALLCSFAAPLMRFHSTDEGGAIVALIGKPGTGKTTALDAAGSVWGEHRALDLNTFDTRASRGVNLGVLGNLPVIYDEMEKQDSDILREFVTIFTNGRDRARATVDGGIRHEARTWQTILIAAANRSIVELVERNNDNDALSSRVFELPGHLPEGMSDREGTDLRNEMKANCGWAAETYVKYLVQPEIIAWLRKTLVAKTEEVWARTNLKSEHRFWVRTIGSVWAASLLVEKLGLLAFSPQRLIDWAIQHALGGKQEELSPHRAIVLVAEYLNDHINDTIQVQHPYRPGRPSKPALRYPNRGRLLIREELEPRRWLLAEKPFKEWLAKRQMSLKEVMRELNEAGVLREKKHRMMTLGAGTEVGGGQVWCVDVDGLHPAMSGIPVDVTQMQQEKIA